MKHPLYLPFVPGNKNAGWRRVYKGLLAVLTAGLLLAAGRLQAQTMIDYGSAAPIPGATDISQLNTTPVASPTINYFDDDSGGSGQTFTTAGNSGGYNLSSIYIKYGSSSGNSHSSAYVYTLRIYSVVGTTVTLLSTYTSASVAVADGDWVEWSGLTNVFAANSVYAYSIEVAGVSPFPYASLASVSGAPYTGGQIGAYFSPSGTSTAGTGGSNHPQYDTISGEDGVFDISFASTGCTPPSPPTIGTAVTNSNSVTVTWTAPMSGVTPTGYNVKRSTTAGFGFTTLAAGANVSGTSFTDNTAVNGTTYYYVVSALNGSGCESGNSAQAGVNVPVVAMVDFGSGAPTPGPNDIAQLVTSPIGAPDINYNDDDTGGAGQTFTTGNTPGGRYSLNSISYQYQLFSSGNGHTGPQVYTLNIYSVSGTTVSLINTYTSGSVSVADGDWVQWTGLSIPLVTNSMYAYSVEVNNLAPYPYANLASVTGQPYTGGQIAAYFPTSGSGTAGTNGFNHPQYDNTGTGLVGVFDVGLSVSGSGGGNTPPFISQISVSGGSVNISGTGATGETNVLYASGNVSQPFAQWIAVATNINSGGTFGFSVNTNGAQQFYRIQLQ